MLPYVYIGLIAVTLGLSGAPKLTHPRKATINVIIPDNLQHDVPQAKGIILAGVNASKVDVRPNGQPFVYLMAHHARRRRQQQGVVEFIVECDPRDSVAFRILLRQAEVLRLVGWWGVDNKQPRSANFPEW